MGSGSWCGECGQTDCWDDPCKNPNQAALQRRAKLRLEAAAPDLLAALELARAEIHMMHQRGLPGVEDSRQIYDLRAVDTAIAKARGGA